VHYEFVRLSSWFHEIANDLPGIFFSGVWPFVIAASLWLAVRLISAVIGEYAKRFWFRRAWKDEVHKAKAKVQELQSAIDSERAEYVSFRGMMETLIEKVDRLQSENIRLKFQLNSKNDFTTCQNYNSLLCSASCRYVNAPKAA
jgi:hypothetical protein